MQIDFLKNFLHCLFQYTQHFFYLLYRTYQRRHKNNNITNIPYNKAIFSGCLANSPAIKRVESKGIFKFLSCISSIPASIPHCRALPTYFIVFIFCICSAITAILGGRFSITSSFSKAPTRQHQLHKPKDYRYMNVRGKKFYIRLLHLKSIVYLISHHCST